LNADTLGAARISTVKNRSGAYSVRHPRGWNLLYTYATTVNVEVEPLLPPE